MYKLIVGTAFGLVLLSGPAMAACSVPNTLTNGTTADATAVMGNFTSLAGCAAPLASPSFTGTLTLSSVSTSPALSVTAPSTSANVAFKSNSVGQASLTLDGASGQAAQVYNYINGTPYWGSGLKGGGSTNFSWYSYVGSQNVLYLQSNGNATLTGCLVYNGGTLGTCLSDARTKKNIAPFRIGLQQVAALVPVTYEYNGVGESSSDGKIRTGLIAQDVQAVAPELVQLSNSNTVSLQKGSKPLLAVKYADLTFALINAVKELKAVNDNQLARIDQLETRVVTLQRKLGLQTASK